MSRDLRAEQGRMPTRIVITEHCSGVDTSGPFVLCNVGYKCALSGSLD